MKTYFKYGGKLASKDIVEAISSPIGVGPFAGFGSGNIDQTTKILTIKPGKSTDKATVNDLVKSVISDKILARFITKYDISEDADVNFGVISRDGYIYTSPNTSIELPIQGTRSSLNEVLVFAKHTKVTEPVDNPIEFEAYWNQSTISFFDIYKKSTDPYYPIIPSNRNINFNANDPFTKVVSDTDNTIMYSYENLIQQVKAAIGAVYSDENMVLVGIYGTGNNSMNSIQESFAIVPYNSVWPMEIPYTQTLHVLIKSSLSRVEDILSGVTKSVADYMTEKLNDFQSDLSKTLALAALPQGSIILWDGATIPEGWEEVTSAQGKVIMGFLDGGISVKGNTVLTTVGSTYYPSGNQEYDFTIDANNLPKHIHSLGITLSDSQYVTDGGTVKLPMVQTYGGRDTSLSGKIGGDTKTTFDVQEGAISSSFNLTTAGNYNAQSTKDSLVIEKLPPTIALKLIRKVR